MLKVVYTPQDQAAIRFREWAKDISARAQRAQDAVARPVNDQLALQLQKLDKQ